MSIFHLKYPRLKHEENSLRGIGEAKRRGKTEIDIDMNPDALRNIYGYHWLYLMLKDGFRDPKRLLDKHTAGDHMSPEEISRLVAGRWPRRYRVSRIEVLMKRCARKRIGARLEPKHPMFTEVEPWLHLADVADDLGCTVRMYALREHAGDPRFGEKCVAAAKKAGIPGKVIY